MPKNTDPEWPTRRLILFKLWDFIGKKSFGHLEKNSMLTCKGKKIKQSSDFSHQCFMAQENRVTF